MRYPASEKLEIIRTVEASHLLARQTLAMLGIPTTTYYRWYDRWSEGGLDALDDMAPHPGSVWNRLPDETRADIIEFALEHEDLTPRELAVKHTDEKQYFVSDTSVCRILRAEDLQNQLIFHCTNIHCHHRKSQMFDLGVRVLNYQVDLSPLSRFFPT